MVSKAQIDEDFIRISEDNISGSKYLAANVCAFFEDYSEEDPEKINYLGGKLYTHFAGMGIVRNTILELQNGISRGRNIHHLSMEIQKRIASQVSMAEEKVADLFTEKVRLATISRSSQVEYSIIRYSAQIEMVYVHESRPMYEGTSLYMSLVRHGVPATLLTDASMNVACRKADFALVGCDSLLGDGTLIHKIGSFPLFSLMHYYSRPNYSIGIGMKEEKKWTFDSYPEFGDHSCKELGLENGKCINKYFELVPKSFIDGFYKESGFTDFNQL